MAKPSVKDPEVRFYPRLSRYYGLSFKELVEMPRVFVRLYVEQLPMLIAQEQLRALEVSAYPHLDADDAESVHERWVRSADDGDEESAAVMPGTPETRGALRARGIQVVMEDGSA